MHQPLQWTQYTPVYSKRSQWHQKHYTTWKQGWLSLHIVRSIAVIIILPCRLICILPLGKLQALPTDGKPVFSSSWHSQDEALYNVAEGIRTAIKELAVHSQLASSNKQTPPQKSIGQLQGEGEVFLAQEQYEEAIIVFDQAIELDPSYTNAYIKKAKAISLQRKKKIQ